MLADMGFTPAQARKALRETVCASFRCGRTVNLTSLVLVYREKTPSARLNGSSLTPMIPAKTLLRAQVQRRNMRRKWAARRCFLRGTV